MALDNDVLIITFIGAVLGILLAISEILALSRCQANGILDFIKRCGNCIDPVDL